MAEDCKCSMIKEIEHMKIDILKGEKDIKEITRIVTEIKEGNAESKYVMLGIKDVQAAMVQTEKENKATNSENFRYIEEKRLADNLKLEKQKEKELEMQKEKDEETLKERRGTRKAIYVAVAVVIANTVIGLLVKYGG